MSLYRIVQAPDVVAIEMEKIHDVRIVPLDNRPRPSKAHTHYMGDARGRWEYACHEGNYSVRGMLSAARAGERAGR